jgi:hypothetical protein
MNRVRTTALSALGIFGTFGYADEEPMWKASSLTPAVIVIVPRQATPALPIPTAPASAEPDKLEWAKPKTPIKVSPEFAVPEAAPIASPPPPPAMVPAAQQFPVIISDFTQSAPVASAPMVVAPEHPPEFRAVQSAPEIAPLPAAVKLTTPDAEPPITELPPVEQFKQAPPPKIPPAKEDSNPLPKPKELPSVPPPGPLPSNVATCTDGEVLLEPVPGMFTSPLQGANRHGVYGSPSMQLSRDYAFRDGVGLDMEQPSRVLPLAAGSPSDHWFVQGEFLVWWVNPARIPVLTTTNTTGAPGILGLPGTTNLVGPGTFGPNIQYGFRVRAGGWFDSDCDASRGFDGSYFFLGQRSTSTIVSGLPVISRPFTQAGNGLPAVEVVAQPGISVGSFVVSADRSLWGADLNYKQAICRTCDRTSAWFAGYRTLTLQESLTMEEFITSTGASPPLPDPPGTQVYVQDRFSTQNTFHGGQLGYLLNRRYGRFDVDFRSSVALGFTHETVTIDGYQLRTRPGQATQSFRGGLLAVGSNLGTFSQNQFAVLPEATVNFGYAIRPNLRAYIGYNFLYLSNVIRPGDQIDQVLDVASVPNLMPATPPSGQARPSPTFTQADLIVQGMQLGLELRW